MTRRGLTLIELMVVLLISVIITVAVMSAYTFAIESQQRQQAQQNEAASRHRLEDRLTELLRLTYVSPRATTDAGFFIAESGQDSQPGQGLGLLGGSADTLTFTIAGDGVPYAALASDETFEEQNRTLGPQGGIAEIEVSTTAVGDPGDRTGLFVRTQRPADGDPTQGGTETVLDPTVNSISFEFWDGEAWQAEWDTRTQNETRRIPAAVRVTYTRTGDPEGQNRVFIVRLPSSDVNAENPLTIGGGTTP